MHSLTFTPAKHKLITHRARFNDSKETDAAKNTIRQHPFQHQIELLTPNKGTGDAITATTLHTPFYYVINAHLSELLSSSFIVPLLEKGQLSVLTGAASLAATNSFTLLPDGLCILRVDSDTYQQLGLTGHRVGHMHNKDRHNGERWEVRIQIQAEQWHTGNKQYDRVMWCLSKERIPHQMQLLVNYYSTQAECAEINFPSSITVVEQRQSNEEEYRFTPLVHIPDTSFLFPSSSSLSSLSAPVNKKKSEPQPDDASADHLQDMFDWLGFTANRLQDLLQMIGARTQAGPAEHQTIDQLLVPSLAFLPQSASPYTLTSNRYTGFFSSIYVEQVLTHARNLLAASSSNMPWCALYVWGIADSPVSWFGHEHDVDTLEGNGENDYIILLLPENQYVLYMMVNAADHTH